MEEGGELKSLGRFAAKRCKKKKVGESEDEGRLRSRQTDVMMRDQAVKPKARVAEARLLGKAGLQPQGA